MKRRPVLINGKFLSAGPTGVRRMAQSLVESMDSLLLQSETPPSDWSIGTPSNAIHPIRLGCIEQRLIGRFTSQIWEQCELPGAAKNSLLVNLCNMAPIVARDTVTAIHDAHVFVTPESSSSAFSAWYRFALPRIARAASVVVTVSEYSKTQLVEHGVAPADKIVVVYNGANHMMPLPPRFNALDRLNLHDRPYVLAPGNVQAHKNVGLLFEVFRRPEMKDITLVLVGPDGRVAFDRSGVPAPADVVFAGHVPDEELKALYQRAVCHAFPSTTEGFGLPPLEAMSLGCPSIVAPCGSLPEVCGEGALYADADDPVTWAQHILELARDGETRVARIAAGRAQAAKFTWGASAARLKAIIDDLA